MSGGATVVSSPPVRIAFTARWCKCSSGFRKCTLLVATSEMFNVRPSRSASRKMRPSPGERCWISRYKPVAENRFESDEK